METSSRPAPTRSILTSSSSLASPPPTSPPTIILSSTSPELRSRPLSQPPASKPGVRFAEEDKEDQIPLGYVLRIKQKREQKARFLQAERQRRVHEEERRKHEEERRRQEEEKKKWDGERAAWDKERRAMEEERKKRAYVEELAATRSRREGQRFGSVPSKHGLGPDGSLMMWEGDRERDRERRGRDARHSYSRPTYDGGSTSPRRQGSDSQVGLVASGSRNQSPGSSRPPSIGGSGSISGSVRGSSQPASIYSTPPSSTPDINARERRESKASRRTSNISDGSQRPLTGFEQAAFMNAYPWNMSTHPIPQFPVMPVLPVMPYMMDMPLLPPNPPFMLQQFGRPPSQNRSHTSSPSPGHHRLPTSQSLERVNQQGSSPVRHERRASGDASQSRRDRQAAEVRSQSHDRQSINSGTSRHSARTQPAPSRPPPTSMKSSPTHGSRSGSSRTSMMSPTSMQQQQRQQQQQQQYHHQQQPGSPLAPVPVMTSSWSQPAFQNLSRPGMPGSSRRQTMPS